MRPTDPDEGMVSLARLTVQGSQVGGATRDLLVAEEPLEIRVNGVPIAVVMRTPGADAALVRGFVITERIVQQPTEIAAVRECTTVPSPEAEGNVYLVRLAPQVPFDARRFTRNLFASSSCGICGKASLESVMDRAEPLEDGPVLALEEVHRLLPRMRHKQVLFEQTGGLHAAAGFAADGQLLVVHEDVGRHNAVDKVVGQLAAEGRQAAVLTVSGRVSFEVVQKALAARIPIIVAVSAPSALAVQLARQGRLTLCGFARGARFSVYSHPERIQAGSSQELENIP